MAKVPLPDRGQPLDLSYIYQLAEAINNLSNELSPAVKNRTIVDVAGYPQQSIRTSNSRIVGGYVDVSKKDASSVEETFTYRYSDFEFIPIITATPYIADAAKTAAGKDATVVLTEITTSQVSGVVRFNTPGEATVRINLLIIGVPVSI